MEPWRGGGRSKGRVHGSPVLLSPTWSYMAWLGINISTDGKEALQVLCSPASSIGHVGLGQWWHPKRQREHADPLPSCLLHWFHHLFS